jgi:LysE type translocator
MPTPQTLLTFALVSAGLMVIPGPSNLFLLAHGIGHGRRSAVAAMTGIETASAIRVLLAAAGLSAVLASSAVAFNFIRWAGVGYPTAQSRQAAVQTPLTAPVRLRARRAVVSVLAAGAPRGRVGAMCLAGLAGRWLGLGGGLPRRLPGVRLRR